MTDTHPEPTDIEQARELLEGNLAPEDYDPGTRLLLALLTELAQARERIAELNDHLDKSLAREKWHRALLDAAENLASAASRILPELEDCAGIGECPPDPWTPERLISEGYLPQLRSALTLYRQATEEPGS